MGRHRGPGDTSGNPSLPLTPADARRSAYERARLSFAKNEEAIIKLLRARPSSSHEAEHALGLRHQTCSSRFSALRKRDVIEPTGSGRKTDSGSRASVWQVTPQERWKPAERELTKRELAERISTLEDALETAVKVADEASAEWLASPTSAEPGNLLVALCGRLKGYRADIDAMHEARAR